MPAPTALLPQPEALTQAANVPLPQPEDDELILDAPASSDSNNDITGTNDDVEMQIDEEGRPRFAPAKINTCKIRIEIRKVPIPPHRMKPLKSVWTKITEPLWTHLKIQVRMNLKTKTVEIRTHKTTTDIGALQKAEDYVRAFALGFDIDDALALLRLDDLYIETFEIKDVKTLEGDHLSRAIGRIAGQGGKTKFAIENASKTRVVLADSTIHILGQFKNIHIARDAISRLIMGAAPGKVYGNLKKVSSRMKERF